jgi:uncharacterized membrane protein
VVISVLLTIGASAAILESGGQSAGAFLALFAPPLIGGIIAGWYRQNKLIPSVVGVACVLSFVAIIGSQDGIEDTRQFLASSEAYIVFVVQLVLAYVGFSILRFIYWRRSMATEGEE